jgi:flavin-dependent dehydrogenase
MLSKYVSKYKIDLKQLLEKVMASEKFSGRFKNAQAMEKPKGWGLPLGAKRRPLSGERFMVLGDAASLIDPFTGEGIGNGMISGRLAAEFCVELLEGGSFNASEMKAYDDKVYAKLGGELSLSKILQKLIQYPWLFNWIIRKIERNEELKKTITFMFEDVQLRKQFTKPSFYLRLLFS